MQVLIDKKHKEAFTMDFMSLIQKYNFQNPLKETNFPSLRELCYQNNSIDTPQTLARTDSLASDLPSNSSDDTNDTNDSEETRKPFSLANQSKKITKQKVRARKTKPSSKGGLWTLEDDSQLMSLIAQYGQKWAKLSQMIPGKSRKQIRDRYMNTLSPGIKWGDWTEEERNQFEILHKRFGNKWCEIAAHMPGRTENQVKNKYYWIQKQNSRNKSRGNMHSKDIKSNLNPELKESEQNPASLKIRIDDMSESDETLSEQMSPSNTDLSEQSTKENMNILVEDETNYWPNNLSQQQDLAYLYQDVDAFFNF